MKRFFIDPEFQSGSDFQIPKPILHHIRDVCRFKEGARFEILTGENRVFLVELKAQGRAEILESRELPSLAPPFVHLAVSIPRAATLEWILEKAVELGVKKCTPFFSEHSFYRSGHPAVEKKKNRWEKLIQMAAQQCGRGELMALAPAANLETLLSEYRAAPNRAGIFAFEGETKKGLREVLRDLSKKSLEEVWVFVGSEGGFSLEEVQTFQEAGLEPVSLGERILRTETACIALVSAVQYELGRLG